MIAPHGMQEMEVSERDIAIIGCILARIDSRNSMLETLVHWKIALDLFRSFEIAYTINSDRSEWETQHRALLTRMLGFTEQINQDVKELTDVDLAEVRLSKEAILANLKYLRQKYSQWYVPVDAELLKKTTRAIENERTAAS